MSDDAQSSLGEKLLAAVQNLWTTVIGQGKVLDHQGGEIAAIQTRLSALESQVHGLKTSRGMSQAKLARAEAQLNEVRQALN